MVLNKGSRVFIWVKSLFNYAILSSRDKQEGINLIEHEKAANEDLGSVNLAQALWDGVVFPYAKAVL